MARKKFDTLTPVQKYSRLRNTGYGLKTAKWVSILTPYITIGIVNFDEYFTEVNGVKMSMGCILAMIVGGIALYNEIKEVDKKANNIVKWAVAFAFVYFFNSILGDLLLIVGCGLVGQIVGSGFDLAASNELEKAAIYKKANIQADSMSNIRQQDI